MRHLRGRGKGYSSAPLPGTGPNNTKTVERAVIVTDSGFSPIDLTVVKNSPEYELVGWHRQYDDIVYHYVKV
jgi:hypothetical protein